MEFEEYQVPSEDAEMRCPICLEACRICFHGRKAFGSKLLNCKDVGKDIKNCKEVEKEIKNCKEVGKEIKNCKDVGKEIKNCKEVGKEIKNNQNHKNIKFETSTHKFAQPTPRATSPKYLDPTWRFMGSSKSGYKYKVKKYIYIYIYVEKKNIYIYIYIYI